MIMSSTVVRCGEPNNRSFQACAAIEVPKVESASGYRKTRNTLSEELPCLYQRSNLYCCQS